MARINAQRIASLVELAETRGLDRDGLDALAKRVDGRGIDYISGNGSVAVERELDRMPSVVEESASPKQVTYIISLLIARIRNGEGGGFAPVDQLINNGHPNGEAIAALTKTEASQIITSLKGDY